MNVQTRRHKRRCRSQTVSPARHLNGPSTPGSSRQPPQSRLAPGPTYLRAATAESVSRMLRGPIGEIPLYHTGGVQAERTGAHGVSFPLIHCFAWYP
jgi:hypothetical protein